MQTITQRFYRSIYITLGLACACLGYAELEFLPQVFGVAVAVGILIFIAYRVEGKWSLSLRAANVVGGVIAIVAAFWVSYQFASLDAAIVEQLPTPTWMLPYLGPLLMVLIPAKLFRPKHVGDFWSLHGIGLITVALGCALTADPLFGFLLLAYLVSLIWSMMLFCYYRQQQAGAARRPAVLPRAFAQASCWAAVVTIVALGLFLCTPRITEARWELAGRGSALQTGVDENRPGIDLNRSGTLTVNREKVVVVRAYTIQGDAEIPKLDLDTGQRWRHVTFNHYDQGRWDDRPAPNMRIEPRDRNDSRQQGREPPRQSTTLPDLGPGQFFLEIRTQSRGGPGPKAEPIAQAFGPNGKMIPTIVRAVVPSGRQFAWQQSTSGDPTPPAFVQGISAEHVDRQVLKPPEEIGVSPPFPAMRDRLEFDELEHLRNCDSVPRLREWSHQLLRTLVEQGHLPRTALGERRPLPFSMAWFQDQAVRISVSFGCLPKAALAERVPPDQYEAVARAFESYLARSGQFRYSLTLDRQDATIDPIEDFVVNSRRGHCTRFATALSLMLRSVGVPTRVVLGYRGFEAAGAGIYDVLQCHAHSWVEALIVRPPPEAGKSPWRWLTLDPTPSAEDEAETGLTWGQWWEHTRQGAANFFKTFIVEYDADQQERARYAVSQTDWGTLPHATARVVLGPNGDDWIRATLLGICAMGGAFSVVMAVRRRRAARQRPADPATAFYDRLVASLNRALAIAPRTSETPGEFAAAAGSRLRLAPSTREVADVPGEVAAVFYRVRFGAAVLTTVERQILDGQLNRLEKVLSAEC